MKEQSKGMCAHRTKKGCWCSKWLALSGLGFKNVGRPDPTRMFVWNPKKLAGPGSVVCERAKDRRETCVRVAAFNRSQNEKEEDK